MISRLEISSVASVHSSTRVAKEIVINVSLHVIFLATVRVYLLLSVCIMTSYASVRLRHNAEAVIF
jgi:hypothetical protein